MTRNLKILFDQVVTELFVLETPVEELRTRMDDAKEQLSMEDDLVRFVTPVSYTHLFPKIFT